MNIKIVPFVISDRSAVFRIADEQLGKDYLEEEELCSKENTCLTVKVDDEVVGFSLLQFCIAKKLTHFVLSEKNWFVSTFGDAKTIGVLKLIIIENTFQKQGIGKALMYNSIAILKAKADALLCICWEQGSYASMKAMLEKVGLVKLKKIESYWYRDSLTRHYQCAKCGKPPCRCGAVVFGI